VIRLVSSGLAGYRTSPGIRWGNGTRALGDPRLPRRTRLRGNRHYKAACRGAASGGPHRHAQVCFWSGGFLFVFFLFFSGPLISALWPSSWRHPAGFRPVGGSPGKPRLFEAVGYQAVFRLPLALKSGRADGVRRRVGQMPDGKHDHGFHAGPTGPLAGRTKARGKPARTVMFAHGLSPARSGGNGYEFGTPPPWASGDFLGLKVSAIFIEVHGRAAATVGKGRWAPPGSHRAVYPACLLGSVTSFGPQRDGFGASRRERFDLRGRHEHPGTRVLPRMSRRGSQERSQAPRPVEVRLPDNRINAVSDGRPHRARGRPPLPSAAETRG